tara:strand:- start:32 stop:496 length:465 start_codon:yes stop_codon:yes gene_type:complete
MRDSCPEAQGLYNATLNCTIYDSRNDVEEEDDAPEAQGTYDEILNCIVYDYGNQEEEKQDAPEEQEKYDATLNCIEYVHGNQEEEEEEVENDVAVAQIDHKLIIGKDNEVFTPVMREANKNKFNICQVCEGPVWFRSADGRLAKKQKVAGGGGL